MKSERRGADLMKFTQGAAGPLTTKWNAKSSAIWVSQKKDIDLCFAVFTATIATGAGHSFVFWDITTCSTLIVSVVDPFTCWLLFLIDGVVWTDSCHSLVSPVGKSRDTDARPVFGEEGVYTTRAKAPRMTRCFRALANSWLLVTERESTACHSDYFSPTLCRSTANRGSPLMGAQRGSDLSPLNRTALSMIS